MNILIVDDESILRTGIRCIIERAQKDWIVTGTAEDGFDALSQMERRLPDVVITDVRMPEMDGIQLSRRISEAFPHVLVIVVSGYSDFQYAKDAMRFGVMEYILKPTRPEELTGALERAQAMLQKRTEACVGLDFWKSVKDTQHKKSIVVAIDYIEKHYAQSITLKDIADVVFMNPNYLSDLFRRETGVQFSSYLSDVRIAKAKELLGARLDLKSYEIAEMVGYSDPKHFSQVFKKKAGVTPKEYRDASAWAQS